MKNLTKISSNGMSKILHAFVYLSIGLLLPQAIAVNVIMQHNDLSRTGANTSETILTTANVAKSFGRLFTNAVDGQVYAQPLYIQNLRISGGTHNVVFVCTESNSVYAFDADTAGIAYWHVKLGTLYVDTKLATGPTHKLHALDITTGSEKFGGPVNVTTAGFTASLEHQRPGLLLLSNVVYLCFGSHCDIGAYHGYMLGYNATNLTLLYSFNVTPTGTEGAIWSGGMAPAADTNGNIYIMTSNGTFDGTNNYSMSMIKLNGSLSVLDYATPADWSILSMSDIDFGSGGPVLLPPHYAVGMGKDTSLFLADITHMGHVGNFTQTFVAETSSGDTVGKSPVYWQGPAMQYLFLAHANNPTKSFQFTGTSINTTPLGTSSFTPNDRVGGLSLSANGTNNGILWEIGSDNNMRAYDAVHFPNVLWTGSIGAYAKMTCPTIANGKVYVGNTNSLSVWGLTNYIYTQSGPINFVLNWATGTLLQTTNLTGHWVTNSASSPYTVVPTNRQMFYRLALP